MTRLSDVVNETTSGELKRLAEAGEFPGLTHKVMLEFLLSDGIMPESGLPVASLISLEDWARRRLLAVRHEAVGSR